MATCSVSNCVRPAKTRTFCTLHYQRWRRHGDTTTVGIGGNKAGVPHAWSRRGVENESTLKATVSPSVRDIAWAAGFIEGEGSFTKRGPSLSVTVHQVNKEPVQRMLDLFGGSLKSYAMKPPNAPLIWAWTAHGARARGIALTVYSFLSARRQAQVRYAL